MRHADFESRKSPHKKGRAGGGGGWLKRTI